PMISFRIRAPGGIRPIGKLSSDRAGKAGDVPQLWRRPPIEPRSEPFQRPFDDLGFDETLKAADLFNRNPGMYGCGGEVPEQNAMPSTVRCFRGARRCFRENVEADRSHSSISVRRDGGNTLIGRT